MKLRFWHCHTLNIIAMVQYWLIGISWWFLLAGLLLHAICVTIMILETKGIIKIYLNDE